MLVWLASYPRSGNTFVRVVLNDVFGIKTRSLDGDGDDRVFSSRRGLIDAVGHLRSETRGDALIAEARHSEQVCILKTHEPPPSEDPAIYIVRDGRSAIVSYFHYLNEVENLPIPMETIIDGQVYAGGWSNHVLAWQPLRRPNTLLLRYERMTREMPTMIEQVAEFCSVQPIAAAPRSFDDLHAIYPEFFRAADDARNIREIEPYSAMFVNRHGRMMQELGYLDMV